jgi:hypothetical protein
MLAVLVFELFEIDPNLVVVERAQCLSHLKN